MTDSNQGRGQKPARSSARQGEQSVRIPRLQSGGKPAADVDEDLTAEETSDATEVFEVVDDEVQADAPTEAVEADEVAAADETPAEEPVKTSRKKPAKVSARDEPQRPGGAARSGSTMTAADYARTTGGSADATSIIPAIRDEDAEPSSSHVTPAASAETPAEASGRRAQLRLMHVDPWSVTKLAFVVSVALMIVAVIAVTIFWVVLDLTGVWDQLNGSITNVLSDNSDSFDVTSILGLPRLVGLTLVLSAINVVVMTALATIAAHLYNLAAQLLGGIELTFGDD